MPIRLALLARAYTRPRPRLPQLPVLLPTLNRRIASNAVAPAFGFQNQLDLSADVREEEQEAGAGGAGGGSGAGGGTGGSPQRPERQSGGKDGKSSGQGSSSGGGGGGGGPTPPRGPAWDSAIATAGGIILLTGAGLCYHYWYKWEVLRKMARAFAKGYDPVLELAQATAKESDGTPKKGVIRRKEQDYVDKVINGEVSGEYLLLMGPKGAGKTSMLLHAMLENQADGCAMLEAHEDPEVVRLRLGKALDFEYNEDSFAGLFQRRDPREAGPILDIERALAKLEKVAIRERRKRNRPLVLIVQNAHFIHDDEDGHALLHMLQQRAEAWSQSGVCTMVFLTDNYWVFDRLRRNATRMHVLSVRDLTPHETFEYLSGTHARHYPDAEPITKAQSLRVWDLIGGRLAYLSKAVKRRDVEGAARDLVAEETEWLHSHLGLIPDHDDDVMDEQKVSSCSFLLFQHLAKIAEDAAPLLSQAAQSIEEPETDAETDEAIELDLLNVLPDELDPKVTYREAREIMTRPDYLVDLDALHVLSIDRYHNVRPDSRLMLNVFRTIAAEEDFQEKLDNVRDRVDAIESLHRTRELTVKTGDADLGGFLRLRIGDLLPQHEKVEEDEGDGDSKVSAPAAEIPSPGSDHEGERLV
ncbi:hypothetical protein JCM10908_004103 [Rhodotorula pacifica]|uniref:ATP-binding protein n=1 Tax=Rhodotorula pacifica TaxID=1495444 RepID=UPI003171258C